MGLVDQFNDRLKWDHFEHTIKTKTEDSSYRKQFPIPEAHRTDMEAQINDWLKMGLIQPSRSRYNWTGSSMLNYFKGQYSLSLQYGILEKLVTFT